MAKFVATNYNIKINGTDFSALLLPRSLSTFRQRSRKSRLLVTAFVQRIGGLKDASVTLDFHQDFGAASVDATLFPLLGGNATVVVIPNGTAGVCNEPVLHWRVPCHRVFSPFASSVGRSWLR